MSVTDVAAAGGVLTLLFGAVTAFFKYGLPALRNGHANKELADLLAAITDLSRAVAELPEDIDANTREALETVIARLNLDARERDVHSREERRRP